MLNIVDARRIMGKEVIGIDELVSIATRVNLSKSVLISMENPLIPYSEEELIKASDTHLLFLSPTKIATGAPFTLMAMRDFFGTDPSKKEPCFYNQDWYLKERFMQESFSEHRWYLIKKELFDSSRGKTPTGNEVHLPSALVCATAFFLYYFHANEILWKHDFAWCSDMDANGDRIYVGRYVDPRGISKNGFNIHRHLSIRSNYGSIECQ